MARPKKIEKEGARIARQAQYDTPEEMMIAVNDYFAKCKEEFEFPDYAGMLVHLGLFEEDVEFYEKKDNRYADIFRVAMLKRQSYLSRTMSMDGKRATGCMNLLKQPENGGFSDKPQVKDRQLKIDVSGVKGGMNAFK